MDIPTDLYKKRHTRLVDQMEHENIDILALNPGPSLFYLTGLEFHLTERPILCFINPHLPLIIVVPELEAGKLENFSLPVLVHKYGEDPSTWESVFDEAINEANIHSKVVGIEPRTMRILESGYIEKSVSKPNLISAEECLSKLRMIKDPDEITTIRKAVNIAETAFLATISKIENNVSERFIAAELTHQLLGLDSDPEFPFSPIVQSGPNSAVPHLHPTDRWFESNEAIVIDWGARYRGYISDITRTYFINRPEGELLKVFQVVQNANTAAKLVAGPGIPAEIVDKAARDLIENAGYGKFFIHRTGHGIGLDGHESPYIRNGNKLLLEPGMTFTIEPGIYIPGFGGVRLEDDILVTETGIESLTTLPYEF